MNLDDFDQPIPKPNKKIVCSDRLARVDAHYAGELTRWLKHYASLIKTHPTEKQFFKIAVTQLFESYENGHGSALTALDKVMRCQQSRRCFQILCPACRSTKQAEASNAIIEDFDSVDASNIKFMTLLVRVEQDATRLPSLMAVTRARLQTAIRNNKVRLGVNTSPLTLFGAFECDLKNLATHSDASPESRELLKTLGFKPKHKPSQYLLHIHAVVGALDDQRQAALESVIEKALGPLEPFQLLFRSLHENKSKEENLGTLAHYMYKARLQFADNVFHDRAMKKAARYHTPYTGQVLIDYLDTVSRMQNFKGLKFECRIN